MRKKVLFISAANSIHTVRWVNALSKVYEVHLVYCKNHSPKIDTICNKVILHQLKYPSPYGYYLNSLELKKLYKKINPSIVNVHYASGYGTLCRMAKLKNVLLSVWGSDVYEFPKKSKINKLILNKNVKKASFLASTSNIMGEELKKEVTKLNKNIYITPFGIDIKKFCKEVVKKENKLVIGMVKTLSEVYGIEYAIMAVKNVIKKIDNKNIELHIYGDGPDKEKLKKLIYELKMEKNIFLKGKIKNDDVPKALNKFDIFLATSNQESFGVAILEAMSCELPVVVTDADGFKEIVINEKNGFIVHRKNVEEISEKLIKLIKDEKLRKEFGINSRKIVEEFYNWENNVKKMMEIYEMISKEGE